MGTFLDANIGESSTSQGPTTGAHEGINSFYQLLEDWLFVTKDASYNGDLQYK
jgi:hypothetical protein